MRRITLTVALLMGLFFAGSAQATKLAWNPKEFMGIEEIHPGMTGYGKTVYEGTKIVTFDIKVIGVLRRLDYDLDMILIRVTSGPVVERKLQSVEGMSGSPIYINNRLIGAYAYGWNFENEPIAGVTPIADMLEDAQPGSTPYRHSGTLVPLNGKLKVGKSFITRVAVAPTRREALQLRAQSTPDTLVLAPVSTPMFVTGISSGMLKALREYLEPYNIELMAAPSAGRFSRDQLPKKVKIAPKLVAVPEPRVARKSTRKIARKAPVKVVKHAKAPLVAKKPLIAKKPLVAKAKTKIIAEPVAAMAVTPVVAKKQRLEAGSAVAASVAEGDVNFSGIGTVTYVKGDTVLAFGHPMFGIGDSGYIMSLASISGIINSGVSSFKMGLPIARVGTVVGDRAHSIRGLVGVFPKTMHITIDAAAPARGYKRHFALDMVKVGDTPNMTMQMLGVLTVGDPVTQTISTPNFQMGTTSFDAEITTDVMGTLKSSDQFCTAIPMSPLQDYAQLLATCLFNPYQKVQIKKIKIGISYEPHVRIATIERVTPDRQIARPGETVNFDVLVRPFGKPLEHLTTSVVVPSNASEANMLVMIAGGVNGDMALRPLIDPMPYPAEGVKGIARFLSISMKKQALYTAQILPSPTVAFHGTLLNDLPQPLIDLFRINNYVSGGSTQGGQRDGAQGGGDANVNGIERNVRPTVHYTAVDLPYLLAGGTIVPIAIDTPDRRGGPQMENLVPGAQIPLLSTAPLNAPNAGTPTGSYLLDWLTPTQQSQLSRMMSFCTGIESPVTSSTLNLPAFNFPGVTASAPLSWLDAARAAELAETPNDATRELRGNYPLADTKDAPKETPKETVKETSKEAPKETAKDVGAALLSKARSWSLAESKDFQRGTHIGTAVTSKGNLVLAPAIRALYHTTDILPWRVAATDKGVFLIGWNSPNLLRVTETGVETILPADALSSAENQTISLTALTADAQGNLLVAGWPDNTVYLVTPTGKLLHQWLLPDGITWSLAVTSDGRRYAAESTGRLLQLTDDEKTSLACSVADKQLYCLTAGANGDLYLASSPRGKVYRLTRDGNLTAIYETKDTVASMAVDSKGNVYLGASPSGEIICLAPNSTSSKITIGMGNNQQAVMALAMAGDDLYAATAPQGGIYRITAPGTPDAEITTIYAREDLRAEQDEKITPGEESALVNGLAVSPTGEIYAVATAPGQVLKIVPRTRGEFLSAVIPTSAMQKWGRVDVRYTLDHKPVFGGLSKLVIATRSGSTAAPDTAWSPWCKLDDGVRVGSPAAGYAQLRLYLSATDGNPSIEYVRAQYQPINQAPMIKWAMPTTGVYWSGKKELKWEAKDPGGSDLTYSVAFSRDGKEWSPLNLASVPPPETKPAETKPAETKDAKPAETKSVESKATKPAATENKASHGKSGAADPRWFATKSTLAESKPDLSKPTDIKPADGKPVDAKPAETKPAPKPLFETSVTSVTVDTTRIPDGLYRLKVTASDKYARPTDPQSAEAVTGLLYIDNTPPVISVPDRVDGWTAIAEFFVRSNLTPITGGKFRLDGGPWMALTPSNGVFDGTNVQVKLVLPDGQPKLTTGEHKLDIVVADSAENQTVRTVTVVMP